MAMGFFSFLFSSPDKYDVRKIDSGMTKDDVRRLFGRPEVIKNGAITAEEWIYTIPFRVFVSIDFDKHGYVTRTYRNGEPCSDQ